MAERDGGGEPVCRTVSTCTTFPMAWDNVARETAVYLKEVLDRIHLPPTNQIPDVEMIEKMPGGWVAAVDHSPHGDCVGASQGRAAGGTRLQFETDERAGLLPAARHLPYKPDATVDLTTISPPSRDGWIPRDPDPALPEWAKARWGTKTVWQWFRLVLTLLRWPPLVMFGTYRRRDRPGSGPGCGITSGIVFPVLAMFGARDGRVLLDQGSVHYREALHCGGVCPGPDLAGCPGGDHRCGQPNRHGRGLAALVSTAQRDAQLIQLAVRVFGVGGGGGGAGGGGTSVSSDHPGGGRQCQLDWPWRWRLGCTEESVREPDVLLDKPFEVGDTVKIKGYEGEIENIGLRSTRLRLGSGHVVTIANAWRWPALIPRM